MYQFRKISLKIFFLQLLIFGIMPNFYAVSSDYNFHLAGLGAAASAASVGYWYSKNKEIIKVETQVKSLQKRLESKNPESAKEIKLIRDAHRKLSQRLDLLKNRKRKAKIVALASGAIAMFFLGRKLLGTSGEEEGENGTVGLSDNHQNKNSDKPYTLTFPVNADPRAVREFHDEKYEKRFIKQERPFWSTQYPRKQIEHIYHPDAQRESERIAHLRKYSRAFSQESNVLKDMAQFMRIAQNLYRREESWARWAVGLDQSRLGDEASGGTSGDSDHLLKKIEERKQYYVSSWPDKPLRRRMIKRLDDFVELRDGLEKLNNARKRGESHQEIMQNLARSIRSQMENILDMSRVNLSHIKNELELLKARHIDAPREILHVLNHARLVNKKVLDDNLYRFNKADQAHKKVKTLLSNVPATDSSSLLELSLMPAFQGKSPDEIFSIIKNWTRDRIIRVVKELQVSPHSHLSALQLNELVQKIKGHWKKTGNVRPFDFEELDYYAPIRVRELQSVPEVDYNREVINRLWKKQGRGDEDPEKAGALELESEHLPRGAREHDSDDGGGFEADHSFS